MKARKELLMRDVAGEHILIPTGEAALQIHGIGALSESGYRLWQILSEKDCTKKDLVDVILEEYDVSRETAGKDVDEFLENMKKAGMIEE